jgi:Tol biopolymer transport system component
MTENDNTTDIAEKPLTSWKEIGSYLGRDDRTVRRWEKDEGLPVRRHMHTSRASVYAYRSELDRWVASRQPKGEPAPVPRWRAATASVAGLLVMVVSVGGRPMPGDVSAAQLGDDVILSRAWSGPDGATDGRPTPDGKFVTWVDWSTGDLALRDLEAGISRPITDKGGWYRSAKHSGDEYAFHPAVSPSGDRVAYAWWDDGDYDLRTIGLDGSDMRVVYSNDEVPYVEPTDWSPDGRQILALFQKSDQTYQIVLVDAADGSVTVLKTLDWRKPGPPEFSPDGRYVAYDFPPDSDIEERDVYLLAADGSVEVLLVDHPANDRLLGWAPDGSHVMFVSTRSGTADAWAVAVAADGRAGLETMVKANLGPVRPMGVAGGVLFYGTSTQGHDLYEASLDLNTMTFSDTPTRLSLKFEGTNAGGDWSPDGRFLAYYRWLQQPQQDFQLIVASLADGSERNLALTIQPSFPPAPHWSPDGRSLLLMGRDERNQPGIFMVSVESGEVETLVRALPTEGLNRPTFLPDGRSILFRRRAQGLGGELVVREIESGDERVVYASEDLHGWALAPDGSTVALATEDPDVEAEEQRVTEVVQLLSIATGQVRDLAHLTTGGGVQVLLWTPDGQEVLVPLADLDPEGADQWGTLVRVSAATGEVRPTSFKMGASLFSLGQFAALRFHPDGRRVMLNVGKRGNEVWTMENFVPRQAGRLPGELR